MYYILYYILGVTSLYGTYCPINWYLKRCVRYSIIRVYEIRREVPPHVCGIGYRIIYLYCDVYVAIIYCIYICICI